MISSKLLSKILKTNVTEVYLRREDKTWRYKTFRKEAGWMSYSDLPLPDVIILAHKAKEILIKEFHQCVWSGNGWEKLSGYECTITSFYGGSERVFKANTEAEAIFEALESF